MKSIRVNTFGGPEVLKLEELPVPNVGENQVLIKVFAVGVNPVETYIRAGIFFKLPELPYTPGGDGSGIVTAVGSKVTTYRPGQRVFTCNGAGSYAEYLIAEENDVFALGEELSFRQGAAIGIPYFTAYRAIVLITRVRKGETVLIHGASGAVGLAAIQLAKHLVVPRSIPGAESFVCTTATGYGTLPCCPVGLEIGEQNWIWLPLAGLTTIGTAGTPEGVQLVKNAGVDHAFCHRDNDYTDKIQQVTGSSGINVIIEMLANVNLVTDCRLLAPHGRIAVVGNRGSLDFNPRETMAKEIAIMGVSQFAATESEWKEAWDDITMGIRIGWVKPIVAKEYPLEDAAKAHHDIINNSGAAGKLVLIVSHR